MESTKYITEPIDIGSHIDAMAYYKENHNYFIHLGQLKDFIFVYNVQDEDREHPIVLAIIEVTEGMPVYHLSINPETKRAVTCGSIKGLEPELDLIYNKLCGQSL